MRALVRLAEALAGDAEDASDRLVTDTEAAERINAAVDKIIGPRFPVEDPGDLHE